MPGDELDFEGRLGALPGAVLEPELTFARHPSIGPLVRELAPMEAGADELKTANALAEELGRLAHWLGLERITVGRRGGFARPLARAVATLPVSS